MRGARDGAGSRDGGSGALRGLDCLRRVATEERILLEIAHLATDRATFIGEERDDDRCDLVRRDESSCWRELRPDAAGPVVIEPLLPFSLAFGMIKKSLGLKKKTKLTFNVLR